MQDTKVTIVVVPRDHFSDTRESLESIYAHSDIPFSLVYVDGRSPRPIARYLQQQADRRNFRLIRTEKYLSPNHARNIGAAGVATPYMVFIDNDVVVAPGWLGALVHCAEETGAAVVSPLTFERRPLHTIVHFAGGLARIDTVEANGRVERRLVDRIFHNIPSGNAPTECAEFHCMLVRAEAFRAMGGLDERMLSTRENLDFCMMLRQAGYEIRVKPASRITYLPPERLRLSDIPFFALRWSEPWTRRTLERFAEKWRLDPEQSGLEQAVGFTRWRRRFVWQPFAGLSRRLDGPVGRAVKERVLRPPAELLQRLVLRRVETRGRRHR